VQGCLRASTKLGTRCDRQGYPAYLPSCAQQPEAPHTWQMVSCTNAASSVRSAASGAPSLPLPLSPLPLAPAASRPRRYARRDASRRSNTCA